MKIIKVIFALYILVLSIYPCRDKETGTDEQRKGIAFVTTGNHDHNNIALDYCTPFCICSCCAAHIQLNHFLDISFTTLVHNTQLATLYFERSPLAKAGTIWQPPKVS